MFLVGLGRESLQKPLTLVCNSELSTNLISLRELLLSRSVSLPLIKSLKTKIFIKENQMKVARR